MGEDQREKARAAAVERGPSGAPSRTETERLHPGDWPPFVPRREWEVLARLLADAARRSNGAARPGARRHLLTWGIGECGMCGARLRVSMKGNHTYGIKKALCVCSEKG